jgi:hypothetical protein
VTWQYAAGASIVQGMRDDVVFLGLFLVPVGVSIPFWLSHPIVDQVNVLNMGVAAVAVGLMLLFVVAPLLPEERLRVGSRRPLEGERQR